MTTKDLLTTALADLRISKKECRHRQRAHRNHGYRQMKARLSKLREEYLPD